MAAGTLTEALVRLHGAGRADTYGDPQGRGMAPHTPDIEALTPQRAPRASGPTRQTPTKQRSIYQNCRRPIRTTLTRTGKNPIGGVRLNASSGRKDCRIVVEAGRDFEHEIL